MALFDSQSLAQPLRETEGLPIEPPEELRRPSRMRWLAVAGCAIAGATTILIASGVGDAPASLTAFVPLSDAGIDGTPGDASTVDAIVRARRSTTFAVPVDGVPAVGRADAKVTLVVVTEYGCSACEEARGMLRSLRERYGADLRIVAKPFATPGSRPSLVGACAAARQGEVERIDEAMWRVGIEKARALGTPVSLPRAPEVLAIARDLGLDLQRYAADLDRCAITVRNSRRELDAFHVSAPGYFINGQMLEGVQSIDALATSIEDELAKATQRIREGTTPERYYQEWVIDLGRTMR